MADRPSPGDWNAADLEALKAARVPGLGYLRAAGLQDRTLAVMFARARRDARDARVPSAALVAEANRCGLYYSDRSIPLRSAAAALAKWLDGWASKRRGAHGLPDGDEREANRAQREEGFRERWEHAASLAWADLLALPRVAALLDQDDQPNSPRLRSLLEAEAKRDGLASLLRDPSLPPSDQRAAGSLFERWEGLASTARIGWHAATGEHPPSCALPADAAALSRSLAGLAHPPASLDLAQHARSVRAQAAAARALGWADPAPPVELAPELRPELPEADSDAAPL